MRLKNKIAIVTGAGGGIGRGTALAMAKEGANVAICDIDGDGLSTTKSMIEKTGVKSFMGEFDIRNSDAIKSFVESVISELGEIDILANIAGIMPTVTNEDITETTVDDILSINLKSAIMFSKYAITSMRRAGGGTIIHMSSVTGHNGHPGVVVYGATKGALMALARGQAMELAEYSIRVNSISPGTVDAPMLRRFIEEEASDKEKARQAFDAIHPRGKVASIDEVASVITFLASNDAINITGEDIRCDGGYCIQGFQPKQ